MLPVLYVYGVGLTTVGSYLLGSFVLSRNPQQPLYRAWFYFCSSVGTWSLGYFLTMLPNIPKDLALLCSRLSHASGAIIPAFFLRYIFIWLEIKYKTRFFLLICYLSCGILAVLSLTPLIMVDLVPKLFFKFYPVGKIGYSFYVLNFIWWVIFTHYHMIKGYSLLSGQRRNQMKYFLFGTIPGFIGGATCFPLIFNIHIPPYASVLILVYVFTTTYAILKYHLLDINLALTRAGIFAVVYTAILVILLSAVKYAQPPLERLLGQNWWIAVLIIGMALATIGPFIYQKLRKKAEEVILKEQKQYQRALLEISHTMILIKDLDRLLKTIVSKAVAIVQVSYAGIYLKNERADKYILKHQIAREAKIDLPEEFARASALVEHLYAKKVPLIGEEMESSSLKAGLAVPCFLDSNMVAFLLIGEKPGSSMYTQDDVNVFTVLSNQTALAIENCQLYFQERQHQQYLRVSSLDRQMAGLAHEIDNPNYALLGSLGSIELALDDLKEVIPPGKMEYIKKKIERARFNSKRISRMITSVREFSRASTGELKPIKFEWIMEGFLNIIEPQFKYNGVTFTQELPDETVWLRANKVEIEQVLVNLGTNSVQAINEIWQKQENTSESRKEITFKVHKKGSAFLRMDFLDTGAGIKKELLEDIFLDFVTTKGSAEGTGLGLSISRKIIQKHNGKIWAESEGENKGATFHIELPIANDLSEEEKRQAEIERGVQGRKDIFIQDFPK